METKTNFLDIKNNLINQIMTNKTLNYSNINEYFINDLLNEIEQTNNLLELQNLILKKSVGDLLQYDYNTNHYIIIIDLYLSNIDFNKENNRFLRLNTDTDLVQLLATFAEPKFFETNLTFTGIEKYFVELLNYSERNTAKYWIKLISENLDY